MREPDIQLRREKGYTIERLRAELKKVGLSMKSANWGFHVTNPQAEDLQACVCISVDYAYTSYYSTSPPEKIKISVSTGRRVSYQSKIADGFNWKAIIFRITNALNTEIVRVTEFNAEQIRRATLANLQVSEGIPSEVKNWSAARCGDGRYHVKIEGSFTLEQTRALFAHTPSV